MRKAWIQCGVSGQWWRCDPSNVGNYYIKESVFSKPAQPEWGKKEVNAVMAIHGVIYDLQVHWAPEDINEYTPPQRSIEI